MTNVTEQNCVGGDISKRNFTVGRLRGKRGISHYMTEAVNDFYGYECESGYFYCCTMHFDDSLNISHQQIHQLYIIYESKIIYIKTLSLLLHVLIAHRI